MLEKQDMRRALAGRIRSARFAALLALVVVVLSVYFLLRGMASPKHALTMSAGDALAHRHELALLLSEEAALHRLEVEVHATAGSKAALEMVARGDLDVAFIQGDVTVDSPNVREVAALMGEPLHLFVKSELAGTASPG